MLSTAQVDEFRTFGFIVLRDYLAEHTAPLHVEVDTTLLDAYRSTYDERTIDGISGHYLPMASKFTPLSSSLICDDGRLIAAAEQLLGGPVIPECPEGVLYFAEAGWHDDDGIGVRGVKFTAYFKALSADTGALRFLPGSHHPDYRARLADYRNDHGRAEDGAEVRSHRSAFPGYVVETVPGDILAFDLHTWHASVGGRDRLAWNVVYQRRPETDEERDRTLRSMADGFEQACRGFDRLRYPIWRDWLADLVSHPSRGEVAERLRADGVLGLPGAQIGW